MKLFKRAKQEEIQNDENWWKDPRLDDEGTYDYLVEPLPKDNAGWQWYYQKCQSCGKHHWLNFESTHYFYCWDGWDSMSYTECWKCIVGGKIRSRIYKIKKTHKLRKEFREVWKSTHRRLKDSGCDKEAIKDTHDRLYRIIVTHEM